MEEEGEDGEKFIEELSASQRFLVDTEMENGRHKVSNFQMSNLDTKVISEKLEEVFNKLDSAAKIIIALRFVLRNVELVLLRTRKKILCSKNRVYCVQNPI